MKKSVALLLFCSLIPAFASAAPLLFNKDSHAELAVFESGKHSIVSSSGKSEQMQCGNTGDLPVPGNYLKGVWGEVATFNPSTARWTICTATSRRQKDWGVAGDKPVPGDFDGDRLTDLAVYRPSTGQWLIKFNSGGENSGKTKIVSFGEATDIPVVADIDGDNRSDLIVVRRGPTGTLTWYAKRSHLGDYKTKFGKTGDVPVPADFNADGKEDIAVWTPASGTWKIKSPQRNKQWGLPGDIPSPSDFDGDGKADFVVYRPAVGRWYVLTQKSKSSEIAQAGVGIRLANDSRAAVTTPQASLDFEGDGLSDLAVVRTSGSNIQFLFSGNGIFASPVPLISFGIPGETVAPGDYDGDGIWDVATIRFENANAIWRIRRSSDVAKGIAELIVQFGLAGDRFAPADFDGDGKTDLAVNRTMPDGSIRWSLLYSSGRKPRSFAFGKNGDKTSASDFDGDGRADFILVRKKDSQLQWIVRNADDEVIFNKIYGFETDEAHITDFNGDGKSEVAVIRALNGFKVIFIDGYEPFGWGLASDTSLFAKVDASGITNPVVFRLINGQGYFFIRAKNKAEISRAFGVTGDKPLLLAPTLTTAATDTGTGGGGSNTGNGPRLKCASTVSVESLGGGFVWKPVSESDSKLAVIFPASYANKIKRSALVESQADRDVVLETMRFVGNLNGGRPTFRASKPGRSYPEDLILVRQDTSDQVHCITVPNPGQRYD